jgi:hypothetical protein
MLCFVMLSMRSLRSRCCFAQPAKQLIPAPGWWLPTSGKSTGAAATAAPAGGAEPTAAAGGCKGGKLFLNLFVATLGTTQIFFVFVNALQHVKM